MNDAQPIGVFDSGIGGMTVVRALTHHLPNENIVYFGGVRALVTTASATSLTVKVPH